MMEQRNEKNQKKKLEKLQKHYWRLPKETGTGDERKKQCEHKKSLKI